PAAVFTTELSLARAMSPLWPEYPPFKGAVEQNVRDNGLAVCAHAEDFNLGLNVFGATDLPSWRSTWITRWNHPDNDSLVRRVRTFASNRRLTAREINLAYVLNRPFPTVGIIGLPALLSTECEQYQRATDLA